MVMEGVMHDGREETVKGAAWSGGVKGEGAAGRWSRCGWGGAAGGNGSSWRGRQKWGHAPWIIL